jgi:hypothetical protein
MEFPQEILDRFLQVLDREISLDSFEQWVYATPELETVLTRDSYLTLLCLDYRSRHAMHIIEQVLRLHVNAGRIETMKLHKHLTIVAQRGERLPRALVWLYHRYCWGYKFLDKLAMDYGLDVAVLRDAGSRYSWNNVSQEKLRQLFDLFYPDIVQEVEKVQQWLREGMIVITDVPTEMDSYKWIDRRGKGS